MREKIYAIDYTPLPIDTNLKNLLYLPDALHSFALAGMEMPDVSKAFHTLLTIEGVPDELGIKLCDDLLDHRAKTQTLPGNIDTIEHMDDQAENEDIEVWSGLESAIYKSTQFFRRE